MIPHGNDQRPAQRWNARQRAPQGRNASLRVRIAESRGRRGRLLANECTEGRANDAPIARSSDGGVRCSRDWPSDRRAEALGARRWVRFPSIGIPSGQDRGRPPIGGFDRPSGRRSGSSPDISPGRRRFNEDSSLAKHLGAATGGARWTGGLRGFWRSFCTWLGLALLANSRCYWRRRLHPIQAANRHAKFPRPGETSGPPALRGLRSVLPSVRRNLQNSAALHAVL